MIKSKRIDSFFKRKTCDEDEKNASTSSKDTVTSQDFN